MAVGDPEGTTSRGLDHCSAILSGFKNNGLCFGSQLQREHQSHEAIICNSLVLNTIKPEKDREENPLCCNIQVCPVCLFCLLFSFLTQWDVLCFPCSCSPPSSFPACNFLFAPKWFQLFTHKIGNAAIAIYS